MGTVKPLLYLNTILNSNNTVRRMEKFHIVIAQVINFVGFTITSSCLLFYALCFYGRVVVGTGEESIVITESPSGVVRSSCD